MVWRRAKAIVPNNHSSARAERVALAWQQARMRGATT
jgi:hypothetical protein